MAQIPLYLDFASGELQPTVDDTGATSDIVPGLLSINYVAMNTDNSDPATSLGYGTWTSLGSSTIGATTVYYYKRTA